MPIKPPYTVSCPKCQKPLSVADQVYAAGENWHRTCFTCRN